MQATTKLLTQAEERYDKIRSDMRGDQPPNPVSDLEEHRKRASVSIRQRELLRRHIVRRVLPQLAVTTPTTKTIESATQTIMESPVFFVDGKRTSYESKIGEITSAIAATFNYRRHTEITSSSISTRSRDLVTKYPEHWGESEIIKDFYAPHNPTDEARIRELESRMTMSLLERETILSCPDNNWRFGHGHPIAFEAIQPDEYPWFTTLAIKLARQIVDTQLFVFVPSEPTHRRELMITDFIPGGSFIRFDKQIKIPEQSRDKELARQLVEFNQTTAPKIVLGGFKASDDCPGYLFYAHTEQFDQAGSMVLASASMIPTRGMVQGLDWAHNSMEALETNADLEDYTKTLLYPFGRINPYLGERQTRTTTI